MTRFSPFRPARLAALAALVLAPLRPLAAEMLPVRSYSTLDGLPHDRVKRVRQDRLGFLWLCTTEGLARFDGREFVTYGIPEGLPVPSTNDILPAEGGDWVATNGGGVAWFEPGLPKPRFRAVPVGEDGGARVNVLHLDAGGTLWAGTDGGLFRMPRARTYRPDASFERVPLGVPGQPEESVTVWAFLEAGPRLLAGTRFGIAVLEHGVTVRRVALRPTEVDTVAALARAPDGTVLAGHLGGGLFFLDPSTLSVVRRLSKEDGLPHASVTALFVSKGRIVAGTEDGIAVVEGSRVTAWGDREGLVDARVSAIEEDRDGDFWLATPGRGVLRVSLSGHVLFHERDGLGSIVSDVFTRRSGELCVVSAGWRLSRPSGRGFATVRPNLPPDLSDDAWRVFHGVLEDREGSFWIASRRGLTRFAPVARVEELARAAPAARYTTRDGLASDDVSHLFEDARGDVWIGTFNPAREPLTRWNRATGRFERFGGADGLPSLGSPFRFASDAAGNVWISYRDGTIARYRRGRFRVLSGRNGFPAAPVGGFASDSRGRLWITTFGRGLVRVDAPDAEDPAAVCYGAEHGIRAFHLGPVLVDGRDRVVFATSRDLVRFDPANGSVSELRAARGLLSSDATGACRDAGGNLWFAAWSGLARVDGEAKVPRPEPSVRLSSALVSGEERPVPGTGATALDLGAVPYSAYVSVEFLGLGCPGERILFEHVLEGLDRGWTAPRGDRSVHWDHLADGRYRFLVRAVGPGGERSAPASVVFVVRPPFWRRWWFLAGAAFLLAASGYAVEAARWRRRREVEAVRARIASDLHDDLGASLSRISILAEVAARRARDGGSASEILEKIGEAARGVVEKLADGIWAVDPRRDDLGSLGERLRLAAADLLDPAGISWRVAVPEEAGRLPLGPDARREVYLVLKEALSNAARHSGARNVTLTVTERPGTVELELRDDGRGLPAGPANGARLVGGRGLGNMGERAAALGASLRVESEPGKGTRVVLRLPTHEHALSRASRAATIAAAWRRR
jgi:signal transduction histidine kinase/ligand-binding sensor domain-containing protein